MMTKPMIPITLVAVALFTGWGCGGSTTDSPPQGNDPKADNGRQQTDCSKSIPAAALKLALEISETAQVIDQKTLYGEGSVFSTYGDIIIVRMSDETEPSDYVVVTSHLQNDAVRDNVCQIQHIENIASGMLPEIPFLPEKPTLSDACQTSIEEAVMQRALEISDTAQLVGTTTLYGNSDVYSTFGDILLVRVSDETEPSDYVVVTSHIKDDIAVSDVCEIEYVDMIASGSLPEVPGLEF